VKVPIVAALDREGATRCCTRERAPVGLCNFTARPVYIFREEERTSLLDAHILYCARPRVAERAHARLRPRDSDSGARKLGRGRLKHLTQEHRGRQERLRPPFNGKAQHLKRCTTVSSALARARPLKAQRRELLRCAHRRVLEEQAHELPDSRSARCARVLREAHDERQEQKGSAVVEHRLREARYDSLEDVKHCAAPVLERIAKVSREKIEVCLEARVRHRVMHEELKEGTGAQRARVGPHARHEQARNVVHNVVDLSNDEPPRENRLEQRECCGLSRDHGQVAADKDKKRAKLLVRHLHEWARSKEHRHRAYRGQREFGASAACVGRCPASDCRVERAEKRSPEARANARKHWEAGWQQRAQHAQGECNNAVLSADLPRPELPCGRRRSALKQAQQERHEGVEHFEVQSVGLGRHRTTAKGSVQKTEGEAAHCFVCRGRSSTVALSLRGQRVARGTRHLRLFEDVKRFAVRRQGARALQAHRGRDQRPRRCLRKE
jgi:hypothetical protein